MQERRVEVERRFLVSPGEARALLSHAVRHRLVPDLFDQARPVAFVRSTYFDTDDLVLFRSQGRRRVRLREYAGAPVPDGIPTLTGACAFELKEVSGGSRRKSRTRGDHAGIAELLLATSRRRSDLDPSLALAVQAVRTGRLRPRLTSFFRRRAFSGDGIRITLDDRLSFARPMPAGRAGEPAEPAEVVGRGPSIILEVKLTAAAPDWLAGALDGFLAMTRFSKFRDGMLAIARADAVLAAPRGSMTAWLRPSGSAQELSSPSR